MNEITVSLWQDEGAQGGSVMDVMESVSSLHAWGAPEQQTPWLPTRCILNGYWCLVDLLTVHWRYCTPNKASGKDFLVMVGLADRNPWLCSAWSHWWCWCAWRRCFAWSAPRHGLYMTREHPGHDRAPNSYVLLLTWPVCGWACLKNTFFLRWPAPVVWLVKGNSLDILHQTNHSRSSWFLCPLW